MRWIPLLLAVAACTSDKDAPATGTGTTPTGTKSTPSAGLPGSGTLTGTTAGTPAGIPNQAPTADAGIDQTLGLCGAVTLDGTGSTDPDGDPLTWSWAWSARPTNAQSDLQAADTARPWFVPDAEGTWVAELTVSDGSLETTDEVTVEIQTTASGDQLDPCKVYLFGTVRAGQCAYDAIAEFSDPNTGLVGFDCYTREGSAQIRNDGRLIYGITFQDQIREFHCDGPCTITDRADYPADVLTNDPTLASPCTQVGGFLVDPDGTVAFQCYGDSTWQTAAGALIHDGPLRHLGYGDAALAEGAAFQTLDYVDHGAGTVTPVSGLPALEVLATRALPGGAFYVAVDVSRNREDVDLYRIDPSGAAILEGSYPAIPASVTLVDFDHRLDPTGALYQTMDTGRGVDGVMRRTLAGVSEVVYSEATSPLVELHISSITTGP